VCGWVNGSSLHSKCSVSYIKKGIIKKGPILMKWANRTKEEMYEQRDMKN
jgi:hypothetical protein